MVTILVSGEGVKVPEACCHGKCMFACSAAYRTGLICTAKNAYVDPGPVPKDCPVFKVDYDLETAKRYLTFSQMYEDGDDRK